MTSSLGETAWRQSEEYFGRIEIQLQQRHEEILARRAALMSGREAFYDTSVGLPEVFIGGDSQAQKRNDALFQTLQSIRHEFQRAAQEEEQNLSRLKKSYLQSVQDSMPAWIDQLREFKLRQVDKIGEERWNADEDYQAIDAIIHYRPTNNRGGGGSGGGGRRSVEEPVTVARSFAVAASSGPSGDVGRRQLAASVPDLSASHRSAASVASAPATAGGGSGASRRSSGSSRLGAFFSNSWSNLRARMTRGGSGRAGGGAVDANRRQQR